MISELILMNGYGLYVWSAFFFTFICFGSLFLVIRTQLLKEQNKFAAKFVLLSAQKTKAARLQDINREILENNLRSQI